MDELEKEVQEQARREFKEAARYQIRCINILVQEMGFENDEAIEFMKVLFLGEIARSLNFEGTGVSEAIYDLKNMVDDLTDEKGNLWIKSDN